MRVTNMRVTNMRAWLTNMRMWIPFHRMLVTRKLVICSNQHASSQHATCPIGIRVACNKLVKDWSVKCQIQTMVFSIICPCPCAHTQHCKRYPLCSSEQTWGLLGTCMRQDAWLHWFRQPPRPDIFVRNLSTRHFRQIESLWPTRSGREALQYSCREASIEYSKLHCERTSLLEASLRAYS